MHARTILFMAALILCGFTMQAQSGEISGILKDASTGELLPGANIYLESTGMGTVTNLEGEYRLFNIPEGTHTVTYSYIGYFHTC